MNRAVARRPSSPCLQSLLTSVLVGLFALGCSKSDDLPQWSPADHDHQTKPQANQFDSQAPPPAGMPSLEKFGINQVVLATWKQNCVPCHGLIGAGDGPQGSILRPTDLTNSRWQKAALDTEIAHTIKKGKGRMPAFPQLPEETVAGLIRLIRLMNPEGARGSDAPTP